VNAHVAIDGLTALRRIDPEDATLGAALCALLRAAGMSVRLVDADGQMFVTESGVSFSVASMGGQVPIVSATRVSEAVAILDAVDPLLVDVEAALGVSLDAIGICTTVPGAIGIQLSRDNDSLIVAAPRDHARRADWIAGAAALPPSSAHMPVGVSLTIGGPRLTVAEASALALGDLLLVAQHTVATLRTPHLPDMTGAFDFSTGQFSPGQTGAAMPDEPPNAAADFMVPLSIQLPDRMTSAASLAALAPGVTLPLGPLTEGMPVELRVADRLLARGELVQLGDRFAVLVEDRADINDATDAGEGD
jgi:flagellar motor switch/type III secretory pathway protein FliN